MSGPARKIAAQPSDSQAEYPTSGSTRPGLPAADTAPLTPGDHNRGVGGWRYVYPVVSRRAGGVSVGVNLNPNHACNYRCVYCQVPDLRRGRGPRIDVAQLERELTAMLAWIDDGDFYARWVPPEAQRLCDVAFSGDGEPTSSPDFTACIAAVQRCLGATAHASLPIVLITNGTLLHLPRVHAALTQLAQGPGRVWCKLDGGRDADLRRINDTGTTVAHLLRNLRLTAPLLPTWVQTCAFSWDGAALDDAWRGAWLALLAGEVARGTPLQGVLLYSVARPSQQAEAPRLGRLDAATLEALAAEVRALGLACQVFP